MDEYKVEPGSPLSAKKHNRLVDLVVARTDGTGASPYKIQRNTAIVKNSSGRDYGIGQILQLTGFLGPTGNSPFEAVTNIVHDTDQPTWHTAIDNLCVTAEPIPDGEYGLAVLSGQCVINTSNSSADRWLMVDESTTYQGKVGTGGIARVLGRIDDDYVVADLGATQSLWRYELSEDSLTPNDTTAKLHDLANLEFATAVEISDPVEITKYQESEDGGYCIQVGNKFYATLPNAEVRQLVTDFVVGSASITIERKNVVGFASDDVDDEVIAGTEC